MDSGTDTVLRTDAHDFMLTADVKTLAMHAPILTRPNTVFPPEETKENAVASHRNDCMEALKTFVKYLEPEQQLTKARDELPTIIYASSAKEAAGLVAEVVAKAKAKARERTEPVSGNIVAQDSRALGLLNEAMKKTTNKYIVQGRQRMMQVVEAFSSALLNKEAYPCRDLPQLRNRHLPASEPAENKPSRTIRLWTKLGESVRFVHKIASFVYGSIASLHKRTECLDTIARYHPAAAELCLRCCLCLSGLGKYKVGAATILASNSDYTAAEAVADSVFDYVSKELARYIILEKKKYKSTLEQKEETAQKQGLVKSTDGEGESFLKQCGWSDMFSVQLSSSSLAMENEPFLRALCRLLLSAIAQNETVASLLCDGEWLTDTSHLPPNWLTVLRKSYSAAGKVLDSMRLGRCQSCEIQHCSRRSPRKQDETKADDLGGLAVEEMVDAEVRKHAQIVAEQQEKVAEATADVLLRQEELEAAEERARNEKKRKKNEDRRKRIRERRKRAKEAAEEKEMQKLRKLQLKKDARKKRQEALRAEEKKKQAERNRLAEEEQRKKDKAAGERIARLRQKEQLAQWNKLKELEQARKEREERKRREMIRQQREKELKGKEQEQTVQKQGQKQTVQKQKQKQKRAVQKQKQEQTGQKQKQEQTGQKQKQKQTVQKRTFREGSRLVGRQPPCKTKTTGKLGQRKKKQAMKHPKKIMEQSPGAKDKSQGKVTDSVSSADMDKFIRSCEERLKKQEEELRETRRLMELQQQEIQRLRQGGSGADTTSTACNFERQPVFSSAYEEQEHWAAKENTQKYWIANDQWNAPDCAQDSPLASPTSLSSDSFSSGPTPSPFLEQRHAQPGTGFVTKTNFDNLNGTFGEHGVPFPRSTSSDPIADAISEAVRLDRQKQGDASNGILGQASNYMW